MAILSSNGIVVSLVILLGLTHLSHAHPTTATTTYLLLYPATGNLLNSLQLSDFLTAFAQESRSLNIPIQIDQVHQIDLAIQNHVPTRIIALDRTLAEYLNQSKATQSKTWVTATYFKASEFKGVTLAFDSRILSAQVHQLIPNLKRIWVISGTTPYPMIDLYPNTHITFTLLPGNADLAHNTRLIVDLIDKTALATDAILVPPSIPDDIFYEIAKIAWDKQIILFSTQQAHISSGALMIFQPDYSGLGEQLAALKSTVGYESLRYIQISLNTKVAEHLNLSLNPNLLVQLKVITQ